MVKGDKNCDELFTSILRRQKATSASARKTVICGYIQQRRSQWPSCVSRAFAADRLLALRVRIPPGV